MAKGSASRRQPPIAIIGGGNMGRAIVCGGMASGGPIDRGYVIVAEPDPSKHAPFQEIGVQVVASASEALRILTKEEPEPGVGQVLLAIKPQMLVGLASEIGPALTGLPRIVISILAGTPSEKVRAALGGRVRVVRAMPNLPATVRQGTTAVCLGAGARSDDDVLARELFGDIGQLVVTIEETMMDAFTAVAGSGPAYVFYLAEAMTKAAVEVGFDPETARDIVRETIAGSGALLAESLEDPGALRAAVTSKGGTTEAAVRVLETRRVQEAVAEAVKAARDRGAELARI